ncbi:MAG: TrbC/VirB2 family protein [bacterium]
MSAITSAVGWIEAVLLGPVATAVGVIAIASVGFAMLTGRLDVRQAARVIIGCFILFGAPQMVRELTAALAGTNPHSAASTPPSEPEPLPLPKTPPAKDPYAGAAMPM